MLDYGVFYRSKLSQAALDCLQSANQTQYLVLGLWFMFLIRLGVSSSYQNVALRFFHLGKLLKALNETLISLIPKVEYPVSMSQYRSINLYNVVCKIIAKILVNRLKPLLGKCICLNQLAFVLGRQIIDNLFMTDEHIYYLKNRRTQRCIYCY